MDTYNAMKHVVSVDYIKTLVFSIPWKRLGLRQLQGLGLLIS